MSEANLPSLFDERRVIEQVLEEICPIDVELLGPTTLDDILAGAEFRPVTGGRHFDLATSISLVSCICSLTQLGLKLWELKRSGKSGSNATPSVAETEHEVHIALSEHVSQQPEIGRILSEHSVSPARVVQTIDLVLRTRSGKADRPG